MTPTQLLHYEFQHASTESEVLAIWDLNRELLKNSSIILSVPGQSPFGAKLPKNLGKTARLISAFAHDDLFFLNDHIFSEMQAGRACTFPITYTVSFDTNVASYIRGLFKDHDSQAHQDIVKLLLHFHPKLNWQVIPYLMENAESIVRGEHGQAIFETILAIERLEEIDIEFLKQNGKFQLLSDGSESINRTVERLSSIARHFTNGLHFTFLKRWEALYVALLFTALEQIHKPGVERAPKKLKELVKFMDQEIHSIFLEFVFIAWNWFSNNKHASIFNKLQKNAPDLLGKIKNISWDIFHLIQIRQEATFLEKEQAFLVPFFLTFDQSFADLVSLSGLKSCLIDKTFIYPACFTNRDAETIFKPAIGGDIEFIDSYLSVDANARRTAWINKYGCPDLSLVRQKLESELLKLQS
jgi:hypothetical protein